MNNVTCETHLEEIGYLNETRCLFAWNMLQLTQSASDPAAYRFAHANGCNDIFNVPHPPSKSTTSCSTAALNTALNTALTTATVTTALTAAALAATVNAVAATLTTAAFTAATITSAITAAARATACAAAISTAPVRLRDHPFGQ